MSTCNSTARAVGRICVESRRRLRVVLRHLGYSVKAIKERLLEEKIIISHNGIYKVLKKYKLTGQIADHLKKRRASKLNDEYYKYTDNVMADNDELTARQLHHMLTSQWPELSLSVHTVRRARWKLGWVAATHPKNCQLVRELNRVKKLEWCRKQLVENEIFDNVISRVHKGRRVSNCPIVPAASPRRVK